MAGALLAIVIRSARFVPSRFVGSAWVALLVTAPLAILIGHFYERWTVFSLVAVASASFVYLALFSTQRWLQAVLTNRFLVYTGTISYGIYLLEKLPLDVAKAFHLDRRPFLALPIAAAATFIIASVSWMILEKPFLKLKRFFEPKRVHQAPTVDEFVGAA
jgi:peptidoglycan/LPS O-acetylase OafA/YrhL